MDIWMNQLARHYEAARRFFPEDRLMILFDIDGTVLDTRHMILHALRSFDRHHGAKLFTGLSLSDITMHETVLRKWLQEFGIEADHIDAVMAWYERHCWSGNAVLEAHRPYAGVMEVIRWFQMQPGTFVGLNTGRPELLRKSTLRALNEIAREYKVHFSNDLLFMNRNGWDGDIVQSKVEGVIHFQRAGYRLFAFVDNEPENLGAVARLDPQKTILLLHANTIFKSKRNKIPKGCLSGRKYDITALIDEDRLPRHIQFVWHGVNDRANLRQFLASDIQWAECDVRFDPAGEKVILRDDSFSVTPYRDGEPTLALADALGPLKQGGRSVKIDIKENGRLINEVLALLWEQGFSDPQVWFNGRMEVLGRDGFAQMAATFPEAVVQCPIDDMIPLILSMPARALSILDTFRDCGVNRFSVSWKSPHLRPVLDKMDRWGFETNIYNVPDLEAFLRAVLLAPRSITSDFNFPKWHYFGRGSGQHLQHYRYSVSAAPQAR
jgi:hypothetical protein